jgi:hypothetical protein
MGNRQGESLDRGKGEYRGGFAVDSESKCPVSGKKLASDEKRGKSWQESQITKIS